MIDINVKVLNDRQAREYIKAKCAEIGSLRAAAKFYDTEHSYLCRIINGQKNLTWQMAARFGLRQHVSYTVI